VAEENKVSGLPLGLLAFLPFILFGCASAANHWRIATGGGLLLSLFYLGVLYRRGIVIKLMDWITLTVFIIGSVLTLGMRWALFPLYNEVLIWSCFAVAAWMSVAIGRPFTIAYARENAPPEFWQHPIFLRLNFVMSLFWSGLLSVNVGLAMIGVIIGGTFGRLVPGLALPMILLILGFVFNSRFPPRYFAYAGYQADAKTETGKDLLRHS